MGEWLNFSVLIFYNFIEANPPNFHLLAGHQFICYFRQVNVTQEE